MRYIPVVDSDDSMNLMYMVKSSDLKDYCELYFGFISDSKSEEGIGI